MKELLEEKLTEYKERAKKIEEEAIRLMKEDMPWMHLAKEGAGMKMLIEHTEKELEKYK